MIHFSIKRWAAWSPNLENQEDWQAWIQGKKQLSTSKDMPALQSVEPMLRRRLSRLNRMALKVCFDCMENQNSNIPVAFASRHGELHRTVNLLYAIVKHKPLSPTDFSLSVHNTSSGLYTIIAKNSSPATALAAADSFACALIEACGYLLDYPSVLLVYADDTAPEIYHEFVGAEYPFALALLLNHEPDTPGYFLSFQPQSCQKSSTLPHALSFLKFLISRQTYLQLNDGRLTWLYQYDSCEKT
jgi:hypothetical protein